MNCEFIDRSHADPNELPKDVIFNHEVHGEIKPVRGGRWHAAFYAVPIHCRTYGHALMQGHGDTPEEAFRNALDDTERDLERQLQEVRDARREMLSVTG